MDNFRRIINGEVVKQEGKRQQAGVVQLISMLEDSLGLLVLLSSAVVSHRRNVCPFQGWYFLS
jgi:hypothetical protein